MCDGGCRVLVKSGWGGGGVLGDLGLVVYEEGEYEFYIAVAL